MPPWELLLGAAADSRLTVTDELRLAYKGARLGGAVSERDGVQLQPVRGREDSVATCAPLKVPMASREEVSWRGAMGVQLVSTGDGGRKGLRNAACDRQTLSRCADPHATLGHPWCSNCRKLVTGMSHCLH